MRAIFNGIFIMLIFLFSNSNEANAPEVKKTPTKVYVPMDTIPKKEIINDLHILHPTFRNKVIKLLYECKKQGIQLHVIETYRAPERQNKVKRRGFSKLKGGQSKHQYYIAVDVVPIVNGRMQWFNYKLWRKIGKEGEKLGLIWGGRWRMRDYPHFEYPVSITEVETIPLPDTILIPYNFPKYLYE